MSETSGSSDAGVAVSGSVDGGVSGSESVGVPGASASGAVNSPAGAGTEESKASAVEKVKVKLSKLGLDLTADEIEDRITAAEKKARDFELGFHKKSMKTADQLKALSSTIEQLRTDPFTVLQRLGHDPDALAAARLEQRLEEMSMPEEKKRLIQAERRAQMLEEQIKARDAAEHEGRAEANKTAAMNKYQEQFPPVLAAVGLPPTKEYMGMLAEVVLSNRKQIDRDREFGIETPVMTYEDASQVVLKKAINNIQGTLGGLKGRKLVDVLGEKLVSELKALDVNIASESTNPAQVLNQALVGATAKGGSESGKGMSIKEFRKALKADS